MRLRAASTAVRQVAELLLGLTHVRLDGEDLTCIDNLDCFSSCTQPVRRTAAYAHACCMRDPPLPRQLSTAKFFEPT